MKILIIGNVGSGKTTLAKKLSKRCCIKYFEIDNIVHNDEIGKKRTENEQKAIINRINNDNKDYIIEGILRKNLKFVLDLVDSIIVIDIDKRNLKENIRKRYVKQKLGLLKCSYEINRKLLEDMYKWMNDYDYKGQNNIIKQYFQKVIVLKSKSDINKYLRQYKRK